MAHRWEVDPISLTLAKPTKVTHGIPPVDMARLSAWQGENHIRRHPTIAWSGLATLLLWPKLSNLNADLLDPSSPLYSNLMHFGAGLKSQLSPEISTTVANEVRSLGELLPFVSPDIRSGPVPILAGKIAWGLMAFGVLGTGLSKLSGILESYEDKLKAGKVPVSPLFPVKRIVMGHPEIAGNYIETLTTRRERTYGSVYICPTGSKNITVPGYPYGFRVRPEQLDESDPKSRGAWWKRVALERAGTIVALPQRPGHELFGLLKKRVVYPHQISAMLDEMEALRPGFWKGKTIELGFPPQIYYDSSGHDPTSGVMKLGRGYGANMVDVSPEGSFVTEMQAVAIARARGKVPETSEASIGVLPVGRVNNKELERMVDQLQRDGSHAGPSVSTYIVSSDSPDPTVDSDILVLYGRNDQQVSDVAIGMQGMRANARETVVPVFRKHIEERRLALKKEMPAYTIAYEPH